MFKSLVLVACFACLGSVLSKPYESKYDDMDIDEILNNDRLYQNYFKCVMDQGGCTPDGAEFRKIIPDAIATGCAECNEKQKANGKKIVKFLKENKPEDWKAVEAKFDPDGTFKAKYGGDL